MGRAGENPAPTVKVRMEETRCFTMSAKVDAHFSDHTTGDGQGSWNTKRVAVSAFFVALSIATSFIEIPIFPAAPFLKYDPSGIFCLLAGLIWGPATGCVVAALPWVFRLFTNPAGAVMSLAMGLAGVLVASLLYKFKQGNAWLVVSLVVAVVASVVMSVLANMVVTPAYTGVPLETVLQMIVPIIIPFNLLKFTINSVVAGIVFTPLKKALA